MTAGKIKLRMYRGDDRKFRFAVTDPDEEDEPVNLTNLPLRFTAKYTEFDADVDAVFIKTISNGITVTDQVGGLGEVKVSAADTNDLELTTTLAVDLQTVDALGDIKTLAKGTLVVEADISRTTP